MAAAAHDPKFAKKVGVPVKVAKEFNQADTGTSILNAPRKVSPRMPGFRGKTLRSRVGP